MSNSASEEDGTAAVGSVHAHQYRVIELQITASREENLANLHTIFLYIHFHFQSYLPKILPLLCAFIMCLGCLQVCLSDRKGGLPKTFTC